MYSNFESQASLDNNHNVKINIYLGNAEFLARVMSILSAVVLPVRGSPR